MAQWQAHGESALKTQVNKLTAENAKLRDLLSRAGDTIAELSGGGAHLVIMSEIDENLQEEKCTDKVNTPKANSSS